jgi:hypothetical protein
MSGIPQFNLPAFDAAAEYLRGRGLQIVSPAELDSWKVRRHCLASRDGRDMPVGHTWGDFLARDVKIVADQVTGLILLDGWMGSRGARLEVFVALLAGREFMRYKTGKPPEDLHPDTVRGYLRSNLP